ncbi:MAG: ABC transporter ATP-binding protein [Candidatus Micrarchaeota archaeon]|nr:ABC transporter ATP-binding protein [Candidatus Micrarchaeota archaeon]
MKKEWVSLSNVGKMMYENNMEKWIMKDISFNLHEKEIIAIVGPSGTGKTMLLRMLAGLETISEGKITFFVSSTTVSDLVSMVFHDFALVPWLSVEENIGLAVEHIAIDKEEKKRRVKKYIEMLGLEGYEKSQPFELSRGLKQKVGVARALAVEPLILLMDEPFVNLDPLTAHAMRDELLALWDDKEFPTNSILMTSHSIEEAVYMADKIIIMDGKPGKIKRMVDINLERPRDMKSSKFEKHVSRVYELLVG